LGRGEGKFFFASREKVGFGGGAELTVLERKRGRGGKKGGTRIADLEGGEGGSRLLYLPVEKREGGGKGEDNFLLKKGGRSLASRS